MKNSKKKILANEKKTLNELKPPRFAESMVEILTMTNNQSDFPELPKGKRRYFKDEKGVFREMDGKVKKGKSVVAE